MKDNVFISEWGPLNQDKLGGILSAKYTKKEVIEARYNAIEILQLVERYISTEAPIEELIEIERAFTAFLTSRIEVEEE